MSTDFQRVNIHTLADARLKELYSENPELTILDALLSKKPTGQWQWDVLSQWVLDVSNILVNVSEIIAIQISNYNAEYTFRLLYEYHQYHALRDKKVTASDSEMFSKEMGRQYRIDELVAHEIADRLKSKEKAAYNLISVTQTRLSSLRTERVYSAGNT